MVTTRSLFRKTLLFLAFILLPMTGWGDITWTAPQSATATDYVQSFSDKNSTLYGKNKTGSTYTPEIKTSKWAMKTANSGGLWIVPNSAITKVVINYLCGSTNSSNITYGVQTKDFGITTSGSIAFAVKSSSNKNIWYDAEISINVAAKKHLYVKFPTNVYISSIILTTSSATYTVTYNANGATSGIVPEDDTKYNKNATVTVKTNSGNLGLTGYTFTGWNTKADGTGSSFSATEPCGTFSITQDTTLYAKWTANIHTLTWATDGGSITSEESSYTHGSVAYGTTIKAPATVVKDGFDFKGWDPAFVAETTMPDNDLTYTAQWQAASQAYDITFVNGGHGTAPAGITASNTTLAALSETGYTCTGWKADVDVKVNDETVNAGTLIANGTQVFVTQNTTFTAQWEVKTTQLSILNASTSAEALAASVNYGDASVSLTGITTPEHYVLDGIYAEKACTNKVIANDGALQANTTYTDANGKWSSETANITLYAKFVGQTYTITYDLDGGAWDGSEGAATYQYGVGYTLPTNVTKSGLYFDGWINTYDNQPITKLSATDYGDANIKATWTDKIAATLTYSLSFSGTSITTSGKTSTSAYLSDMADLSSAGVSFSDAPKNGASCKISTTENKVNNNYLSTTFKVANGYKFYVDSVKVSVVAVSTKKTIEVNMASGTTNKSVSYSQAKNSNPSSHTYGFDAFIVNGTTTMKIFGYGATDAYRLGTPITIYGRLQACTMHNITYNETKGAANPNPAQYEEGVGIESFEALPDVEGFKFLAWNPTSISASETNDVEVTAIWQNATTYEVTFNSKGGSEVASQNVVENGNATTPDAPTKENYTFKGWSLTDGGDIVTVEDITITQDTTFFAIWKLNTAIRQIVFSNSFDARVDAANKSVMAYYMAGETAPSVLQFDADNIKSMAVSGNTLVITDTEDGVENWNLTLEAVNPLTSFEAQNFDGTEVYVKLGDGFKDGSWIIKKNASDGRIQLGTTREYFFFGPSEKAVFTSGKDSRATIFCVNGDTLTTPTATAKSGNTFEIALNENTNNMVAFISNQTNGDGGVKAVQLAPVYDVTFVSEKGTAPAATTAKSITLPEITGVEGFDHMGWKANKAVTVGGSAVAAGDTMAVGAVAVLSEATEFTACWRVYVPKYTVTFNANGGTPEPTPQVVDENTKPAAVADPAKDHAAFQGWSLNGTDIVTVTDVVITQDTTFYAIWKTKYDVTFDTKGGTAIEARQIVEGETVGAVTDPEKWDNTFAGWNKQGSAEIIAKIEDEVITANVIYEANWTPETGVIKLIEGGAINTTNFITGATMQEGTITYQGVDLPFARHGGNATSVSAIGNNLSKAIIYNATTTQTKIKVVANNNPEGTSARYIYIWSVLEGSAEATKLGEYELKDGSFVETPYLECNNAAHRSIYITTSSYSNVAILQVKVIESGDALVKVGEAGYSLNMNKGRMVMVSGQDAAQSFEDLNFVKLGSNYGVVNSANLSLASTNGKCSFTVANDIKLSVTTSTTKKYYVTQSLEEKTNETTPTANTATSFDLTPGTWYIVAGGSAVGLTNISFSKPNAPKPEITTQPQTNKQFDPSGNLTATVEVAAVSKGTLTYQWYNASNDSEVAGATAATLTTTTEGSYYVIITNTLADHRDNSVKSETAQLGYRKLDDATLSALGYGETAITLVDAQYTYEVELAKGTTEVPALTATTSSSYATKVITDATAFVDYKATSTVVVTAEDGTTQLTYTVNFTVRHDLEQVSVSETTVWNWTNAASQSIKLTDLKNVEVLMANIAGVNNDANFNSQALIFYGENVKNTDGGVNYASIGHIKFTTTIPGLVTVEFADNGNNNRRLKINDSISESSASKTDYKTFSAPVKAGEVTLMGVKPDKTGTNQYIRIRKITFTAAEFVRGGLVPGRMYTTCQANNMLGVWGVEMYEPENWDGFYVTFKEAAELKAGYGYLFVATEAAMYAVFGEDEVSAAVAGAPNAMQGTLEDINLPEGNNYCGVKNNHLQYFGANNTMTANHAYIVIDEINKQPQAPASARRIRISREGSSVVTGLDNVAFGGETDLGEPRKFIINDQVVIIRNGQMFNAQGAQLR